MILAILNEAWSDNWGFIPLTDAEIAYAGKKLKPIVLEDMILVAEYDGRAGRVHDGAARHQRVHRRPEGRAVPVRLGEIAVAAEADAAQGRAGAADGRGEKLHATRLASQLAFMMIEYIRRAGYGHYGISRAEVGWILDDNAPMLSIADAIESRRNRTYRIYEKAL